MVVQGGGSRVRLPGLESWLCLLLDMGSLQVTKLVEPQFSGLNNGADKDNIDFRGSLRALKM